jgi:hypothetical protein
MKGRNKKDRVPISPVGDGYFEIDDVLHL